MADLPAAAASAGPVPATDAPAEGAAGGRRSLRSGMGFAASSFGVTSVIGLLSSVVTARIYGLEVIGEFALVMAPWLLLSQLSNIGEQRSLTRELATVEPRDPRATALFLPILAFSTLLTTLVALPVTLLAAGGLTGPVGRSDLVLPAVAIVVGYVLVENAGWNLDAVFAAFLAGRELFIARIAQVAGFPALAVALYPLMPTVAGLTIATVLSFVLALAVRLVMVRRFMGLRASPDVLREGVQQLPAMLAFGLRLLPNRLAGAATNQAGIWILGSIAPILVLGAYARASSVAVRLNDAGFRIGEILFPALVRHIRSGDLAEFSRVLDDTVRRTAFVLLLIAAPAGGAAAGLLDVFGPGFDDAAGALSLLLLAYAVSVVVVVQSQALLAVGRPGLTSWLSVLRAAVAIALMWPLARWWEGTGIALALLVSIVVCWQAQAVAIRRVVPGAVSSRKDHRLFVVAIVSTAAGHGTCALIFYALPELVGTIIGIPAGLAVFLAVAIVTGWIRGDERARGVAVLWGRLHR